LSQIQSQAKTGASRMMNIEFTDWRKLAGTSHPPITRSVRSRAKRLSEEPACSKPDQKTAEKTKSTTITASRFLSVGSRPPATNM
jgi:hypothetical protein